MEPKGVVAASQPKWFAVSNPPKDSQPVLMRFSNGIVTGGCLYKGAWYSYVGLSWARPCEDIPTHWMPADKLPDPPKEDDHG